MFQVNYNIVIGKNTYALENQTQLVDLQVKASLDVPVNVCRLVFAAPRELEIAVDDSVAVELGYGDELALIFRGIIHSVEWSIDRVTIHALSAFTSLTAARFNRVYEKSNAGDIVKDVMKKLKLSCEKVESGIQFAVYALGENQTAYAHLQNLARQCGFDFYANSSDKAVFAQYNPETTHEFNYGMNILTFDLNEQTVPVTGVEVYGESPASSSQGAEASSWLTKTDVKGTAGTTSGIVVRVFDPTARTQNNASEIAKATLAAYGQKQQGMMKVLGEPKVKLGEAVKVYNMPSEHLNGTFKVTGIAHSLNPKKGFFTVVYWEKRHDLFAQIQD